MNVLIVDDGDLNRTILGEILKFEGYLTIEVEDGMEALAALDAGEVHVIISDLLMPRMDGLRLCTEVRKRQETRNIPFILYTGTFTTPLDQIEETSELSNMLIRTLEDRNTELVSKLKEQQERMDLILERVLQLYSLMPICGNCKRNRVDEEYWAKVRAFVEALPGPLFPNPGVCDECGRAVEE